MINYVIFDLDGTLLDTSEGIIESVIYAVQMMKYPSLNYDELLDFVGPPLMDSFLKHLVDNESEAEKAVRFFREHYANKALLKAVPYEGIIELLQLLKKEKVCISVATYKPEEYAIKLIEYFNMDVFFNSIHGADKKGRLKKKEIVELCLKDMNGTLGNAVLIGDTSNDGKAADELGMRFLPVTYGFGYHSANDIDVDCCIDVADCPAKIGKIVMSG